MQNYQPMHMKTPCDFSNLKYLNRNNIARKSLTYRRLSTKDPLSESDFSNRALSMQKESIELYKEMLFNVENVYTPHLVKLGVRNNKINQIGLIFEKKL